MENLTTIQINKATREHLKEFQEHARETYDETIFRMMKIIETIKREPNFNKEFIQEIKEAEEEIRQGKGISTSQLMAELGLKNEL